MAKWQAKTKNTHRAYPVTHREKERGGFLLVNEVAVDGVPTAEACGLAPLRSPLWQEKNACHSFSKADITYGSPGFKMKWQQMTKSQ